MIRSCPEIQHPVNPVFVSVGARATVESRVIAGEATAAELLHHLAGAREEALLPGVLHQARAILEAALVYVEAEREAGTLLCVAMQHIDVAIGIAGREEG